MELPGLAEVGKLVDDFLRSKSADPTGKTDYGKVVGQSFKIIEGLNNSRYTILALVLFFSILALIGSLALVFKR